MSILSRTVQDFHEMVHDWELSNHGSINQLNKISLLKNAGKSRKTPLDILNDLYLYQNEGFRGTTFQN